MLQPSFARALLLSAFATCCAPALASDFAPETALAIDAMVTKALADTSTPSVSVAIVKDGQIVYARAYGDARQKPDVPATTEMRYKIASNSKQFAAAAILMLAEQGKLKLDDPVSRYFPDLSRAKEVTLRQLLSHTSGYPDYYAPDYLQPSMSKPVAPQAILTLWAKKGLDFDPGTRWQYSNTNYVILGQVVEKVSGESLDKFLRKRVFDKLHMDSVIDNSVQDLGPGDPNGHTRYALGPVRTTAGEGRGWMYATGDLAMTASDLARWDISLMNGTLLKPASLKAMTTQVTLKDGTSTNYAFGLDVSQLPNGHRKWSHTGGAAGFLSMNTTYPDDHMSITVLTNGEGRLFGKLGSDLEKLLLVSDASAEASLESARKLFLGLQKGEADRAAMTDDLFTFCTPLVLGDFAASLAPLGEISSIVQSGRSVRGGMVGRRFTIKMSGGKTLGVAAFIKPDGRFDQFLVSER